MKTSSITWPLDVSSPFDFDLTASVHGRFAAERVNIYQPGLFRRAFWLNGRAVVAILRSLGSVQQPRLELTVTGTGVTDSEAQQVAERLNFMFGLSEDLSEFYAVAQGEAVLAILTSRFQGLRPVRWPSLYELLVGAITSQQITLSFAAVVKARFVERYGQSIPHEGTTLWTFPSPEELSGASVEELMILQYSRRKAEYLVALSEATTDGTIDKDDLHHRSDEAVIEALTQQRGLGRWTAEWALIRGLGRPDVVPVGDVGVQRAVAAFYPEVIGPARKASPEQVAQIAEGWRPFRAFATHYLLTALRFKE